MIIFDFGIFSLLWRRMYKKYLHSIQYQLIIPNINYIPRFTWWYFQMISKIWYFKKRFVRKEGYVQMNFVDITYM